MATGDVAVGIVKLAALKALFQDDIDDSSHGRAAVNRARAGRQDFDALDGGQGDAIDVRLSSVIGGTAVLLDTGHSPSIHQHQGLIGSEPAQIDGTGASKLRITGSSRLAIGPADGILG